MTINIGETAMLNYELLVEVAGGEERKKSALRGKKCEKGKNC